MNKEDIILRIARDHFPVDTLETRNRDSLDFHEVSVGSMRAALSAAYEAGITEGFKQGQQSILENPRQAAPYTPPSTLIYIEDTNDTLELFAPLQGQVEVRMREQASPVDNVLVIPLSRKDDVDWLYARCNTWRMATFRMLCDQLTKL